MLVCFGLAPLAQAVNPPPDGGYPGANTAEGTDALLSLTSGIWNTALGFEALNQDTVGRVNTGTGVRALFSDTSGSYNSATGVYALYTNVDGRFNNAVGAYALANNIEGDGNTANGYAALYRNTANFNTATGYAALYGNTTGGNNTANGSQALLSNTAGISNTATGDQALVGNTTGGNNTAVGRRALQTNTIGNNNTGLGRSAGLNITGSRNVCIGASVFGEVGVDDRTYIRNVNTLTQNFSAGVNDYVTVRLSDGRLGHTAVVSSQRYKEDIKPLAKTSQVLYALKPVSFRLKKEFESHAGARFWADRGGGRKSGPCSGVSQ
jgi:hypothetical protein